MKSMDGKSFDNKENMQLPKSSEFVNELQANCNGTNTCGAKPKDKTSMKTGTAVPHDSSNKHKETASIVTGDLNDKLKNWKAAGIAFRQALGKVGRNPHKLPVSKKDIASTECSKNDIYTSIAIGSQSNSRSLVNESIKPLSSDSISAVLKSRDDAIDVCDINYLEDTGICNQRTSQPLYMRRGSLQHNRLPMGEMWCDQPDFGGTKDNPLLTNSAVGDSRPCINSVPSCNNHSESHTDGGLSRAPADFGRKLLPSTSCLMQKPYHRKSRHKNDYKSKLPVPVWRSRANDKPADNEQNGEQSMLCSNSVLKNGICRLEKKCSLESSTVPLSGLKSSDDSFGDITALDKSVNSDITSQLKEVLALTEAVDDLVEEVDEDESTDDSTGAVLREAALVLGDDLYGELRGKYMQSRLVDFIVLTEKKITTTFFATISYIYI